MQTVDTDIVLDVYNVDYDPPIVKSVRDDNQLRYIKVYLTDKGNNYSLQGDCSIYVYGKKPGGEVVEATGSEFVIDEVTEDNPDGRNGIEFCVPNWFTDTVGDVECQFRLVYNNNIIGQSSSEEYDLRTQMFIIRVFDNFDHDLLSIPEIG